MAETNSPARVTSTTENTPKRQYTVATKHPVQVARRNARERNRVRQVNMGFITLRNCVPAGAKNKKLSKVETLRQAAHYIQYLQEILSSTSPDSTPSNHRYYPASQSSVAFSENSPTPAALNYGYSSSNSSSGNPSENFNPVQIQNSFYPQAHLPNVPYGQFSQDFYSGTANPSGAQLEHQTFNYGSIQNMDFGNSNDISMHQAVHSKISPQNTSDPSPSSSFLSDASYEIALSPQELKYSNNRAFVSYS